MSTPHEAPAVAMTERHAKVFSVMAVVYEPLTDKQSQRIDEIAANIRSQVQGMKLYDAEERSALVRAIEQNSRIPHTEKPE